MIIKMNEFGTSLVTRVSGRRAYDEIMASTDNLTEKPTFDFEGVETVTNSFADEVFGRIALERGLDGMRESTSFVNIRPFWARVVRNAINNRAAEFEAAIAQRPISV